MKFYTALYLILSLFVFSRLNAQINTSNLGQFVTADKLKKLKTVVVNKLSDARSQYDSSSFNYAVALRDNAGLFENEQRFKSNQKLLLEALKSTDGEKSTPVESACNYNEIGEMLYSGNRFSSAESSFKKAIKLFEQEGATSHPVYSLTLSNLGLLYHTTGRFALAEKYSKQALDKRKEVFGSKHAAVGASINNIAVLKREQGNYNEAETQIEEALEIIKNTAGKNTAAYALVLNNKAMIFQSLGRYKDAEPLLQESIDIASRILGEKSTNYIRLMTNLALLYQDMKEYAKAENIYKQAIKIKERRLGTNHPDYAHLLSNLASLYMEIPKYSEVEDLLKRSIAIYKKQFGENHPSYATAISNLGNFYRTQDRTTESETLLKQALAIRKETLGESHPDFLNAQENLGLLYWQTNNLQAATPLLKNVLDKNIEQINTYFAPLSEAEKGKLWDKMKIKFQRFNSFVASTSKENNALTGDLYNYQLATKALLLNSTSKVKQQILSSGDETLIKQYQEWINDKEYLARLYTLSKSELSEEHINIDSLEKACNLKEKSLASGSGLFSQGFTIAQIKYTDIQKRLNTDEAAIEIIQFKKFHKVLSDTVEYLALILTKEKPFPSLVLLENGNQLEKKYYNIYKNSIRIKIKDETSYTQFYSPLEKEISTKNILYLSLDGIFNQINLNTILTPTGYLIDKKTIHLVTNTKEIIALKTPSKQKSGTAVLCGYPVYGTTGTLNELPGTKKEIESIKSILTANKCNTKVYLQNEASETSIKSINNPKILHIATHGFFIAEPDEITEEKVFGIESEKSKENPLLRSGLMLAGAEDAMDGKAENGILFSYEVMNLALDNTDLVILSACETGLGDVKNGEGVYGLQRAFQVAGADAIIMSLWKVSDDGTQQLMTSFYKYYVASGNIQTSFKKAQQELKLKFKDPYYWGAFVLVE